MKTPKEKAKELISINSLTILSVVGNKLTMDEVKDIAKQFALSEVDEIDYQLRTNIPNGNHTKRYWLEVKEEIEKL